MSINPSSQSATSKEIVATSNSDRLHLHAMSSGVPLQQRINHQISEAFNQHRLQVIQTLESLGKENAILKVRLLAEETIAREQNITAETEEKLLQKLINDLKKGKLELEESAKGLLAEKEKLLMSISSLEKQLAAQAPKPQPQVIPSADLYNTLYGYESPPWIFDSSRSNF